MQQGIIRQIDHPSLVYDMPADQFVGGFIGNPPMNFLEGRVQHANGQVTVGIGDFVLTPELPMQPILKARDGQLIGLGIRAENMEALSHPADDALQVEVLVVEPLGAQNLLTVEIGKNIAKVSTHPTFVVSPGQAIWLRFPAAKIRWVDRDSGQVLYPA
jgi:multiple sugar transport system ATP-binding protein